MSLRYKRVRVLDLENATHMEIEYKGILLPLVAVPLTGKFTNRFYSDCIWRIFIGNRTLKHIKGTSFSVWNSPFVGRMTYRKLYEYSSKLRRIMKDTISYSNKTRWNPAGQSIMTSITDLLNKLEYGAAWYDKYHLMDFIEDECGVRPRIYYEADKRIQVS